MTVEYLAPLDGESLKDVSGYPDTAVDTVPVGSQAGRKMETSLIKDAFNGLSAFGFAFAVLGTWSSLVVGLGSGLAAGGPSSLLWGFVYATLGNLATTLSHSECLAVFPTAGGQYHWAAMLSPPRWRASISWTTGLLNVISLWFGASSCAYLSVQLLVSAIRINIPQWDPMSGQEYAIFAAVVLVGPVTSLVIGSRANRWIDKTLMMLAILGALAVFVVLLAMAKPKAPASFVFGGTNNTTGWDSMGMAWLLGGLQSAFSYLAFDIVYHICEELPDPRKEAPKVVNMTIVVGGVSGLLIILACLFAVEDIESLLATDYGLPFAQLCLNVTNSPAATTVFLLIPSVLFMNSVRGLLLTASRVLMSLGRDKILPRSDLFQIIVLGDPAVGLILSVGVVLSVGLVQLGSTAAFSSLLGSATIFFEITYGIPIVLMLCGGRARLNRYLPHRSFNLGRWGVVCNLAAMFFVVESCVIYCFPGSLPVAPGNMNYVYSGGFGAILLGIWFLWARKRFPGPEISKIVALSNRVYIDTDKALVADY